MKVISSSDLPAEEFYAYTMKQEKKHGLGYSPLYNEARAWAKKNAIFLEGDIIAIPKRRGHDYYKLLGVRPIRNKKHKRIEISYFGFKLNPMMKPLKKNAPDETICPCCVAKATLHFRPQATTR